MVTTRRRTSQRLNKKARIEEDDVQDMDVDMISSSSDDFQDPPPMPAARPLSRKAKGKQPVRLRSETSLLGEQVALVKIEKGSSASSPNSEFSTMAGDVTTPTSIDESKDDARSESINFGESAACSPLTTSSVLAESDSVSQQVSVKDEDEEEVLEGEDGVAEPSEDEDENEEGHNSDEDSSSSYEEYQPPSRRRRPAPRRRQASPEEEVEEEVEEAEEAEEESEEEAPVEVAPVRRRRRTGETRGNFYLSAQKKVAEQHPELSSIWDELEEIKPAKVVPVKQPDNLVLPLLPFQKYGVGWMLAQEKMDTFNGGILADEMGMGKTIQTIALLLSDKEKPNLVIAPNVAILQWKSEIEKHTNGALSVLVFHGYKRTKDVNELMNYDVVLSTYAILETCFRKQEYGYRRNAEKAIVKEKSILHKIQWHRIVLDEAHNIKDRSSNTARSVFNLNGRYRWSLTGTPLQNRVGELYSLIRFMQADPFAYYYCKKCPCKEIAWRFSDKRTCDSCGHTPMQHICWWNNEVLKPIQIHGYVGDGRKALEKLRLLLDRIMLRRTKIECADDLGLPPRTVVVRRDIFSEEEEDLYTSLYSDVARTFSTYVEQGTVLNNYANIFELLTKMRQCADHPDLVVKKRTDNKQLVCMLCNDPPEDAIAAACKHVFCRECCVQYYNSFDDATGEKPRCPSCFAEFTVDLSQPSLDVYGGESGGNANYSKSSIINRINMNEWRSSTKIEALVEELSKLRREDKTIKSIVFSQFVNFLDLIYWRLSRAGFECIRLDGTMTPEQKDAAIRHFMTKPTVTVFLISLKAGGVALNLTEASRVFICDPWWNPATELQAMDRIHRLGQYRPIRITRLIIENSIESRIVQLQEKKTALVDSTVGKNPAALDKLTVEDLRFLFVM